MRNIFFCKKNNRIGRGRQIIIVIKKLKKLDTEPKILVDREIVVVIINKICWLKDIKYNQSIIYDNHMIIIYDHFWLLVKIGG